MAYGDCKVYGFSLFNHIKNKLFDNNEWIELGIPLPFEEDE